LFNLIRINCRAYVPIFSTLLLSSLLLSTSVQASEKHHPHFVDKPLQATSQDRGTQVHSCMLRQHSSLCREYVILDGAVETISELKEGCESMPAGKFESQSCTTSGLSGRCMDIVRNYHKPDVIYDNYYYSSRKNNWTQEKIQRVCSDLGGELVLSDTQ